MARRRRRFRLKPAGYAVVGVLLLVIGLCIYAIVRAIVGGPDPEEIILPEASASQTPEIMQSTQTPVPEQTPSPTPIITPTPFGPTPTPITYTAPPTNTPKPLNTPRTPTSSEKKNAKIGTLQNDDVNLREGPSTDYERIGKYDKGATMKVYDEDGDFYFVRMDKDEKVGFISKKFVVVTDTAAVTIPPDVPTDAVGGKVTATVVALRKGPNQTDGAITELEKGDVVFVYYQVGEYYYVEVASTGRKGFAAAKYIHAEGSVPVK